MSWTPPSIVVRTLLANAAVFAVAFLLLALSPITISAPIRPTELVVLGAGAVAMAALNWLLVRRALAPLQRLAQRMGSADLTGGAATSNLGAQAREVAVVIRAFEAMVERLADERRQTSRAVLAGQESERARVARELHDEIGQSLIALALQAERAAASADPADRSEFEDIAAKIHFNLDELRRIAHELRPEALDDLGLVNALIALCGSVAAQASLVVERDLASPLPQLSEEQELVVYRVAQEALSNTARHSGADRARVELRTQGADELVLRISDDGRGIPAGRSGDVGIKGMHERAMLAGARLTLKSPGPEGRGTEVEMVLPVRTPS